MTDFKHIEEQIAELDDRWSEKGRSAFDCANCGIEANAIMRWHDTMQAMLDVVRAAEACKNGCRRCNCFQRYPDLRKALDKLKAEKVT